MIPRFSTYHPSYGHGFFLSKPGVHVYNTDPNNFLLHSHYKNEQVLMAGYIEAAPSVTVQANYPVSLSAAPMLYFSFSTAGFGSVQLPYDQSIKTLMGAQTVYAVTAVSYPHAVTFTNHMALQYARIQYIVLVRAP